VGGDTPMASCRPCHYSVSESGAGYPIFAGGVEAPNHTLVHLVRCRDCRAGMGRSVSICQYCSHIEWMRRQTHIHFI
jgi:hypothetical protein